MKLIIRNSSKWDKYIKDALITRKKFKEYRKRKETLFGNNKFIEYKSKRYLNFSSNDYLGLSKHPSIIEAWKKSSTTLGVGSGGSSYTVGYSIYHKNLEKRLANWLEFPCAILFNSGFSANQSIISSLITNNDKILADRFSHNSLLGSSKRTKANLRRFQHNNIESLKKLLDQQCLGKKLVVTEGVFSMDGDQSPITEITKITHDAKGWILLDDAHGIGVLGPEGKGSTANQIESVDLLVITFGKAFGISGAAVLCNKLTADYLLQFSSHLIYSTALPPAQVIAIDSALTIIKKADHLRENLAKNINYFRNNAKCLGLNISNSNTAIQPLIIGDNKKTVQMENYLKSLGLWIIAIRPPTVPPNQSRLRITLTAKHKFNDIDILLEALIHAKKNI